MMKQPVRPFGLLIKQCTTVETSLSMHFMMQVVGPLWLTLRLSTKLSILNLLEAFFEEELALAKIKEERFGHYDWSVISTASEVNEYFKVLKTAMGLVYPELANKTEHIGHGMVRLTTGKMSSRTGDVIPAIDFIDEVAAAAASKMAEGGDTEPDTELARDVAIAAIKYSTLRGSI